MQPKRPGGTSSKFYKGDKNDTPWNQDLLWKKAVGREKGFHKEGQRVAGFLLGQQPYSIGGGESSHGPRQSSKMSEGKMAKIRLTIRQSAEALMQDTSTKISELKEGLRAEVERR